MKRTLALSVAAVWMIATSARADISTGSVSVNATGATCSGGASVDGDCRNSAQTLTNNGTTLATRYAWNINADTAPFSTHVHDVFALARGPSQLSTYVPRRLQPMTPTV